MDSSLSSASSAINGNYISNNSDGDNKYDNERTSILYGAENVINAELNSSLIQYSNMSIGIWIMHKKYFTKYDGQTVYN